MIWDLFEGGNLFTGQDPEHQRYRSRAHIAEIIALLGQPPQPLLSLGKSSHKFFTDLGISAQTFQSRIAYGLRRGRQPCRGKVRNASMFLAIMRKMLQWEPSKRFSAKALAEDAWIKDHL